MKQLTVRGVDPTLDEALRREAKKRGLSVNRAVLVLLREATGLANGGATGAVSYRDLDHLAGTWDDAEYARFEKELREQRAIDEDLWR